MRQSRIDQLQKEWDNNPRWEGIERPYSAEDVIRLKGSLDIEYTLAQRGAEKLWDLVNNEDYVHALGALTGNKSMQQLNAGLTDISFSDWLVAATSNLAEHMY